MADESSAPPTPPAADAQALPGPPRTIRLTLAYDGGGYAGWQWQPGKPTVQGMLEAALHDLTGEPHERVEASGRTDAGVHALGQVASFVTRRGWPAEVFVRALNVRLPPDIVVLDAAEVPATFHPRRSARRKRYRYVYHDGPQRDPFRRRVAWHVYPRLNEAAMHAAAQAWRGRHDFRAFETAGSPRRSTVRTVFAAEVTRGTGHEADLVCFEIEADGFLYNMVRAMAGTLREIGRGAAPLEWAAEVLAAGDRSAAGMTAPPEGLFLVRVEYAGEGDAPPDDEDPPS